MDPNPKTNKKVSGAGANAEPNLPPMGALRGLGSPSWQLLIQLGSIQCPSSAPPRGQIRHGHVGPKLAPTSDTCPGRRHRGRRSPGHPAAAGSCPGLRGTGRAHQLRAGGALRSPQGPAGPGTPHPSLCATILGIWWSSLVNATQTQWPNWPSHFPHLNPSLLFWPWGAQLLLAPTIRGCQGGSRFQSPQGSPSVFGALLYGS